jgi:hypothetical protein
MKDSLAFAISRGIGVVTSDLAPPAREACSSATSHSQVVVTKKRQKILDRRMSDLTT